MSVARPEPSDLEDEASEAPAVDDGDATDGSPPSSEESPPSSAQADHDRRASETQSHAPPPSPSVNTRVSDASNSKQARIREAEEDRGLIARAQKGDTAA